MPLNEEEKEGSLSARLKLTHERRQGIYSRETHTDW